MSTLDQELHQRRLACAIASAMPELSLDQRRPLRAALHFTAGLILGAVAALTLIAWTLQ